MAVETPVKAWADTLGAPGTASGTFAIGTRFTPLVSGNLVGLGCRLQAASTRTVKLWRVSDSALLASQAITIPGGTTWTYSSITAVPLVAGVDYIVSVYFSSSTYYRTTGVTFPRTQGNIQMLDTRYAGTDTFPNTILTTNVYTNADIQFDIAGVATQGLWGSLGI